MSKSILRKTETKVAVKLYGSALNETVSLATDCLATTEALTVGGTPTVNILTMRWMGAADAVATITRNGVIIATLQANSAGDMDFLDQEYCDSIENTSDLVVTSTGLMQVYLLLRKVSGYSSKIETAQFSVYDNQSVVGS